MNTDNQYCKVSSIGGHFFTFILFAVMFFTIGSLATHKKEMLETGKFTATVESFENKNDVIIEIKDNKGSIFELIGKRSCVLPEKIDGLIKSKEPVEIQYTVYKHSSFFNMRNLTERVLDSPITKCEEHV